jgi:regulator of sigma E protease
MMQLMAIDWAMVGIKAGQLILSLSILVILHEFGHYITARWFGCRVEKFYLFFDPWFSLVKKKIGDTEYGIGWLPLGGYVKISGMIDESMDKESMKLPPKEWEFRSKPAWQRLIIMLGGIIVNVLLAIFIYSMILFTWGEEKVAMSSLKYGISFQDSIFHQIGLQKGDLILRIDDQPITYLDGVELKIITGKSAVVKRNNEEVVLNFPVDLVGKLIEQRNASKGSFLLEPRVPAIIGSFDGIPSSNAKDAGVQENDRIVAIESTPVTYFDEMGPLLKLVKTDSVTLQIERGGTLLSLRTKMMADYKLGVPPIRDIEQLETLGVLKVDTRTYGFFESFPAGAAKTATKLKAYIDQFKLMLKPETGAYKGLGGFKAIANAFPGQWDWESFWNLTAFLSIVLAFMNLLPIPALDGGHVMFTLYEMITRRKPNEKFLEYAQMVGMILLLLLMVYANANDWLGWGK